MQLQDFYPIIVTPYAPPGPETFTGAGMCLEFQVADAASAYERFHGGVWIDVVEQIKPAVGWWDRYLPGQPEEPYAH